MVLTGAASYGPGSGPIFIESLRCDQNEVSILDCDEVNMRRESCTHDQDVSIQCTGMQSRDIIRDIINCILTDIDECSIANGNCSHTCVNEYPSYHCDCPPGGQLDPTNLTCVFNAVCTSDACQCLPGYTDSSMDHSLNCTGMFRMCSKFGI